ncbi:TetR/AcrR family transcriptional regulator [Terricaulis sp.]|uniref:TetR/AcrR family transcriptional regulator n=1 Tax=Terricaulis sp. TaxID=2768686 RepID=UPI0037837864
MKVADDLRRTLLDASLDLIETEGLEAFSMREVARRAGVSHQAPYHHFPDREAILAAIVVEGFAMLREAMRAGLEGLHDPYDRHSSLGRTYISFALSNPAHFKLMFRSEHVREDKHDDAKASAGSAFDTLVEVVNELAREKYGREDFALALTSWSLAHGLATLLLEGKLDDHFGKGRKARLAAAESVLKAYDVLVRS